MADARPSVAVIMRTKDRPLFLERALASVTGQTFTDYELVVVNDGGDEDAVEELVARHPAPAPARIRIVHHPRPVGLFSPPNEPIRQSNSELVAIHDDDDSWAPAFLERAVEHLRATGAMGVIVPTDRIVERVADGRIELLEQARLHPGLRHVSLYELCFENFATPIAFLYRREAFDEVGGYDESLGTVADWDFAIRFGSRYEIEVVPSPEALAFYHHRPAAGAGEVNSVYTDRHRHAENLLANRYLREDLAAGRPGLGFLVNALRHEHGRAESSFDRYKEAADERVDYLAACVRKVEERVAELQEAVTPAERLRSDLRFLRGLPGRIARRVVH